MPQQPTIDEALTAFLADQRERLAASTYARYDVMTSARLITLTCHADHCTASAGAINVALEPAG